MRISPLGPRRPLRMKLENIHHVGAVNPLIIVDVVQLGQDRFRRGEENGLPVGPNIIDDQWIYGPSMMEIFNTILSGCRNQWQEAPHNASPLMKHVGSSIRRRLEPPRRRQRMLLPK